MLILVTYDVNTENDEGKRRLRKVAKFCVKYGQRVQNSVFECILDEAQYRLVQHQLQNIINPDKDSLRFYNLGKKKKNRTEHFGAKESYEAEGTLIL